MANYGKTWWGKKWLETFTGIDYSNRLARGRTYANTGRAYDIKIENNTITAKVEGSRPTPYKVKVILTKFEKKDKEKIHQIISDSPTILSALINKQVPEQLLQKLSECNINLFPSSWKEVKGNCSCPDHAIPCKHIAAVIYLICAEIDKNPFIVFQIHDCDLLDLIVDFSGGKLENIQKILQIEDIFDSSTYPHSHFDPDLLQEIDLSKIEDISEHIKGILKNDPPFYDKNFRDILYIAYKHCQGHPYGDLGILSNRQIKNNFSEEENFTEKWQHPEQWDSFQLLIDDRHRITAVLNGENLLFSKSKDLTITLIQFLQDIPNAILHKLSPELRFMHAASQFAKKLMEKSGFIPQILQNKREEILVRWIPALFNQEVKSIYDQLCSCCPENLISYSTVSLRPEEQVKAVMALILGGYIRGNFPSSFEKRAHEDIYQLFFMGELCKFKEFASKELPASINQWLSKLYLSDRQHKIYLMIEDKEESFELDLRVSLDDKLEPITVQKALEKGSESKLAILSDLSLISEYIPQLETAIDSGKSLYFDLDDFAPLFIRILPVLRAVGISVILPKSLQKILKPRLNLGLQAKEGTKYDHKSFLNLENLLDFDWRIAIGDTKISLAEFKKLLKESRGLIRIIDQYVLLDEKEMQSLLKQLDKLPNHLNQIDLMQAALASEFNGASVDLDHRLSALFKQLDKYEPISTPHNLHAQLRPYQTRGFHWLVQNIRMGFGSILADDMGLGKTLQVIATILHLKNEKFFTSGQRVLIIAPTSLLSNWQKEIQKFAPDLNLCVYHGQNRELANEYDILITSYGIARKDKKELNKYKWFLLVIDEAQNIKNLDAEQTKAIKSINSQHKIAMSGTPVENRLLEYWSIFDFSNKHYLGTPKQFKDNFAIPIEKERDKDCLERFKKVTTPFILRRLKSDKNIIQDLPSKIENNRYCSLTAEQTALYQEVVEMSLRKIAHSDGIVRKGLVLSLINSLKQICNHPSQFGKKTAASIEQSGKAEMLEEILLEVDSIGEKSLIFTQYTEMGEILARLLGEKFKCPIPFLHGGLSRKARDEMVHNFQHLPSMRILIISLKAGGTGLNLTAANHVVHYDLWWNPAVEAQATDRAYRIGQKQNVMVHRLLTMGTFEERIDEMIKSKKELADLAVGSGENWITEMSTEQLRDLVDLRNF